MSLSIEEHEAMITRMNHSKANQAAMTAVYLAIRRGELLPVKSRTCADCGCQASNYHHDKGYAVEHRLSVVPLCRGCHMKRHVESRNRFKRIYPERMGYDQSSKRYVALQMTP